MSRPCRSRGCVQQALEASWRLRMADTAWRSRLWGMFLSLTSAPFSTHIALCESPIDF